MATRAATARRRAAILNDIRAKIRSGALAPGAMLPPVRVLSRRYELSLATVAKELSILTQDGILTSIPRVGVFVSTSARLCPEQFVVLSPPQGTNLDRVRQGFEQRIAQLGASTVVLPADDTRALQRVSQVDELAGVFDPCSAIGCSHPMAYAWGVPTVAYSYARQQPATAGGAPVQIVRFNDFDGGRQATEHLLHHGHRNIAYLGSHTARQEPLNDQWSAQRSAGWLATLQRLRLPPTGLEFAPAEMNGQTRGRPDLDVVVERLASVRGITAVVGATDQLVLKFLHVLKSRGTPADQWPAVVGFDDDPAARKHVISSLQLPWEQVGRTAADLLWSRRTAVGSPPGPLISEVPMTLISRASSVAGWSQRIMVG